jgi:tetratricopeptide (TPR) repeat protein
MRSVLLLSLFLIAAPMSPSPAQGSGDSELCGNGPAAAEAIAACTRLLQDRRLPPYNRAVLLNNRAIWQSRSGQAGPALRDVNQALALQPRWALLYVTRGLVYESAGQRPAAAREYNRALSFDDASAAELARKGLARLSNPAEAAPPEPPATPNITFRFWRRGSDTLYLRFFSSERNHIWPGVGRHWVLNDNDVQTIQLNCRPNEKICYGAWIPEDDDDDDITYWGAGKDGDKACSNCCHRCLNQTTNVISLNPSR